MPCSVCGKNGRLFHCAKCGIKYCSKKHQREDWPKHKLVCRKPNAETEAPPEQFDLKDFISITPDNLGVTPTVIGVRVTATAQFYQSLGASPSLHNGGQLPPATATFPRPAQPLVFVLHHNKVQESRVPGWQYIAVDQDHNDYPITPNAHVVILVRPGRYHQGHFWMFDGLERARRVEIIGDSADIKSVVLQYDEEQEEEEYAEEAFIEANQIRLCNVTAQGIPGCEGFVKGKLVEVDGVCADDQVRDEHGSFPNPFVNGGVAIVRDSTFTFAGNVVHSLPVAYVLHCTFRRCGQRCEWDFNDPFLCAPIIRCQHDSHVMICNCDVDENSRGHLFHRSPPLLSDIDPSKFRHLFTLLGPGSGLDPEAAMAKLQAASDTPEGITVLRDNRIDSLCCSGCDTAMISATERRGLHCLPTEEATAKAMAERFKREELAKIKTLVQNSVTILPADAPAIMKRCVARWNLSPPYCLNVDWQTYWNLRDSAEKKVVDISDEFMEEYENDDTFPEVAEGESRHLAGIKERIKKELDKVPTPAWHPDNHQSFSPFFRSTVRTLLLCLRRMATTHPEQEVWGNIPTEVLSIIFSHLAAEIIPKQTFLDSIYVDSGFVNFEDADMIRTFDIKGWLFSSVGNGVALNFSYHFHQRARWSFMEMFSSLDLTICCPGRTKAEYEWFGKDDQKTNNVLEFRLAQEQDILRVAQLVLGNAYIDTYTFYRLIFIACGSTLYGDLDRWPLEYADCKYKQRLPEAEFREKCPETEDHRSAFEEEDESIYGDEDDDDDDMGYW